MRVSETNKKEVMAAAVEWAKDSVAYETKPGRSWNLSRGVLKTYRDAISEILSAIAEMEFPADCAEHLDRGETISSRLGSSIACLVVSEDDDWLFPEIFGEEMIAAIKRVGIVTRFLEEDTGFTVEVIRGVVFPERMEDLEA